MLRREIGDSKLLLPCPTQFNLNRYLMSPPIDWSGLPTYGSEESGAFVFPWSSVFVLPRHASRMGLVGGILLFAVVGLFFVSRAMRKAWFCGVCKEVTSGVQEPELVLVGICSNCVSTRIRGSMWDPKATFFEERRRMRAHDRQLGFLRGISYLAPGIGDLFVGRPLRGILIFGAFVAFVGGAVGWLPGQEDLHGAGVGMARLPIVQLCGALVVYALNIWSVSKIGEVRGR